MGSGHSLPGCKHVRQPHPTPRMLHERQWPHFVAAHRARGQANELHAQQPASNPLYSLPEVYAHRCGQHAIKDMAAMQLMLRAGNGSRYPMTLCTSQYDTVLTKQRHSREQHLVRHILVCLNAFSSASGGKRHVAIRDQSYLFMTVDQIDASKLHGP